MKKWAGMFSRILSVLMLLALMPHAGALDLSLARQADLINPEEWIPWLPDVTAPSSEASVKHEGDALVFRVPDQAGQMSWRHSLRPVWLDFHRYLTVEYSAVGFSPEKVVPLIKVHTNPDSWRTVLNSGQIQADGGLHVQTIDLASLASYAQIIGVIVHIEAHAETTATLALKRLDFTDQPPGYVFPDVTPLPPAPVGFDLDISRTDTWRARPEWLGPSNISLDYSLESSAHSLIFRINDASRGMKWSHAAFTPIDTLKYNHVLMRYRCREIRPSGTDYALFLSGTGGEARPFYQESLLADGVWHDIAAPLGIPSVNQMAAQVQSNATGGAFLEIEYIRFTEGDPRIDLSYYTTLEAGWDGLTSGTAPFLTMNLEPYFNAEISQLLPRMSLNVPWFSTEEINVGDLIPFRIKKDGSNILSTSIPGASTLEIPVHQAASEIYFVLGAFLPARENPSNENIISQVDESERFLVELCYADGTRREYFPLDISAGLHKIPNMTFSACAVPTDMTRPLASVRLHDRSDGGLFALAALTLNLTAQPFFEQAFAISPAKPLPILTQPPFRAPECIYDKEVLVLRNTFFEYTFDCSEGLILRSWVNAWTGRNLPGTSFDGRFFSGTMDGQPFTSGDFLVGDFFIRNGSGESTAMLHMRWKDDSIPISAVFTAALDHSCEARFHLSLVNDGDTSHTFEILLPDLPELVLSDDPKDTHYAFPGLPFQSGNLMVDVEKPYSGQFPVQFMDLYNPAEGWGVCLMTRDLDLLTKYYRLRKKADGVSSLSVRYPTLPSVGLPARGRMETAPFTLAVHGGDWHEGLRAYQRWVSSWYAPVSPRQKWFQELYTCRRDYPVGGSGYLFDRSRNAYTFPVEFDNAEKHLGGPDMLDISSWGWSAAYGRVGEYRRYELGGLADFRSAIAFAHGKGIPVGLYIEGYLLDERCTIFGQKGGEWKMLNADGSDQRSGREVTICPSVPEWQDWMARLYADVLRETDAAALYIDQFGVALPTRRCYHPGHSHPPGESPLRGEVEMARKIRAAVSAVRSGVPLYVEFTPVDAAILNLDGSFAYTTWYGEDVLSPTRTTISRFCFPDFRQFELVHGQFLARNWTEEGLKKAFFNGQGLWIKGDLGSWYDAPTRLFDRKSRAVFLEHRDAFTSAMVEPFLPVLKERIFAHRFGGGDKSIITLYNSNWSGIDDDLIRIGPVEDCHIVDLWKEVMLDDVENSSDYRLRADLSPRDVGCVGLFRRRMTVRQEKEMITVTFNEDDPPAHIEVVSISGETRTVKTYDNPRSPLYLDIGTAEIHHPEKIILKFIRDDMMTDMIILNNPGQAVAADFKGWVSF